VAAKQGWGVRQPAAVLARTSRLARQRDSTLTDTEHHRGDTSLGRYGPTISVAILSDLDGTLIDKASVIREFDWWAALHDLAPGTAVDSRA
jgi:hypothetical protein